MKPKRVFREKCSYQYGDLKIEFYFEFSVISLINLLLLSSTSSSNLVQYCLPFYGIIDLHLHKSFLFYLQSFGDCTFIIIVNW